ncbi:DUF1206 domain-containing protein [Metabacillus herbersteinensis]|uniref:DUF1206 domain-containing protein n=1 Tax=Metabacillus herbersteinensis TaxID=283816 RepID=A0ABV6GFR0_9BACI
MQLTEAHSKAKNKVKHASTNPKPWIRRFAQIGYFSKGAVYILVGILSLMAALGIGGKTSDTSGVFSTLASKPFGEILIWLIAIGLIGYVMWRLIQVIKDPEQEGTDLKGIFIRVAYLISGIIYGSLAFKAITIALHAGNSSGNSEQSTSAKLLSQPFGQWLVGILGLIIIGYGIYEFYNAYKEKFAEKFKVSEMNKHEIRIGKKAGKIGLSARGIVLSIIGYFFIRTALTADPDQAKGMDGALAEIAQEPFGQWMLGLVAIGLILYGVYLVIKGRYRHMNIG